MGSSGMTTASQPTTEELLQNSINASENLDRARSRMEEQKSVAAALAYCHAHSEALAARKALPPLRLVK